MQVGIVGINHKSSTLPLREALAKAFQKAFEKKAGVLLSTCNRTEFYFCTPNLTDTQIEILFLLRQEMNENFKHALYSYFGFDCFNHLGQVVSGLDSAIFGESEIQRQVKLAYEHAKSERNLPHEIHYLFQKALRIGKKMRSSCLMEKKGLALSYAIYELIQKHCRSVQESTVLLIGNSAINRKLIAFLQFKGAKHLTLCTRMKNAVFRNVLVENWNVLRRWNRYDVVISGTNHNNHILKKPSRSFQKTLLFDLSVPRNIDPKLGSDPDLKLYNIDQIGKFACEKIDAKQMSLCENLVKKSVARQIELFKGRKQAKWERVVSL